MRWVTWEDVGIDRMGCAWLIRSRIDPAAEFASLMGELRALAEHPADEAIQAVLDRSGYRQMLAGSKIAEDEERLANIEELITAR